MTERRAAEPIPEAVAEAARQRADARTARDWATADRLRDEIETAGWRVVDRGTTYRLEAAHPPEVVDGGRTRYGRSDSVPSRLDEPDSAEATVVVVAAEATVLGGDVARAVSATRASSPGTELVVVGDGLSAAASSAVGAAIGDVEAAGPQTGRGAELVLTSAPLGQAAALNIGIRRAGGAVVVLLDPSVEPTGDFVTPLVAALSDPGVAVAGAFGLASADLRRFEELEAVEDPADAAAIEGYALAFRRAEVATRGPLDEHFRFYRNLDIWWSLVLRDEGEGRAARRAIVVPGLPLRRHEHRAWTGTRELERDRLSKRNFYRVLDRFGRRADLAVPGTGG